MSLAITRAENAGKALAEATRLHEVACENSHAVSCALTAYKAARDEGCVTS